MKSEVFGNCPEEAVKDYEERCRELFPLASALKPPCPAISEETAGDGGKGDDDITTNEEDSSSSPDKPPQES